MSETKKRRKERPDIVTPDTETDSVANRDAEEVSASGTPDADGAAKRASQRPRKAAGAKSEQSRIRTDPTYSELQQDNRVVMRHQIALNLDSFRAASDTFDARPQREYPPLQPTVEPFFSVVVPNYNGIAHLPTVMAALDGQTFRDFEIVVVDDASVDQSLAWLEEHYPQTRLIVNRRNLGFAVSCNLGAGAARGRFVALLNTDTEPEADWLAETARAICRHPEARIFAGKLLLFDRRDTLHAAGDAMGRDGVPRNRGVWQKDDGRFDLEEEVFGACGGAAVIRRDLWESLGGFDESLWMYLEDADFAFRSRLLGIKAVFVPTARVYHHLSGTSSGELSSYLVGRNTIWALVKNMPGRLWLRYWPAILAGQARTASEALQAYRGAEARARLRGMAAGLLGLPAVLAKRRVVQAQRVISDEELAALLEK